MLFRERGDNVPHTWRQCATSYFGNVETICHMLFRERGGPVSHAISGTWRPCATSYLCQNIYRLPIEHGHIHTLQKMLKVQQSAVCPICLQGLQKGTDTDDYVKNWNHWQEHLIELEEQTEPWLSWQKKEPIVAHKVDGSDKVDYEKICCRLFFSD